MAEPLLSSLCRICNTNPPKYRCPRCASQTCSLACSKRHKLWSTCSGVRDPTIYKPRRELVTPAGIDHDYNFISSIERGIERTDKVIIEEKGLVDRKELLGDNEYGWRLSRHRPSNDTILTKSINRSGVILDRAPKGMKRNLDNATSWSKNQRCINWQVEWLRDDGSRILGKLLESHPLGDAYAALLEEKRRANMTEVEKKEDKKRKADEIKQREAKRVRRNSSSDNLIQQSVLQNPESCAWDIILGHNTEELNRKPITATDTSAFSPTFSNLYESSSGYYFYLHRPYTPSSHPRVLIPLHPSSSLLILLRNRVVLEFPTIYVLSSPPTALTNDFMLEHDYLAAQKHEPFRSKNIEEDTEVEDGEVV